MPDEIDLESLSPEQLDEIMNTGQFTEVPPEVEAPPVEAETPVEEEAAPVESQPEEPEEDPRDKRIRELEAHNSRLAGKLGYEQNLAKARTLLDGASDASDETTTWEHAAQPTAEEIEALRVADFENKERIAALENERDANAINRVNAALVAQAQQLFAAIDDDIKQEALNAHAEDVATVDGERNPEQRAAMGRELLQRISVEASTLQLGRRHEQMQARKTAASADMAKAKRAQAPSASGGVAPPPPKTKTAADMTAREADTWLRENVR